MNENKERNGAEETKKRKVFSFSRISSPRKPYEYLLTAKPLRSSTQMYGTSIII
ncbi:MAG TPA: hypothetical protein VN445_04205 [Rectinemataceae bacterium]|nr:hypothetical protein [Rectinemataceae bacterium]